MYGVLYRYFVLTGVSDPSCRQGCSGRAPRTWADFRGLVVCPEPGQGSETSSKIQNKRHLPKSCGRSCARSCGSLALGLDAAGADKRATTHMHLLQPRVPPSLPPSLPSTVLCGGLARTRQTVFACLLNIVSDRTLEENCLFVACSRAPQLHETSIFKTHSKSCSSLCGSCALFVRAFVVFF